MLAFPEFASLRSSKRGFPGSSTGTESACNAEDPSSIAESGRSPEGEIGYPLQYSWASMMAQMVKRLPTNGRSRFDPWVRKIPWRRKWQPIAVLLPGESQGQQSGGLPSMGSHRVGHD